MAATASVRLTRRIFTLGTLTAVAAWPFARSLAAFEQKQALLVGNLDYKLAVGELKNTLNDVDLIARALERHAFEAGKIKPLRNVASKQALFGAVDAYLQRLAQGGADALGFFYYCGHGVANQSDGQNYLIPTGIADAHSPDLWTNSVATGALFDQLARHKGPQIVVLDCCRSSLNLPGAPSAPAARPGSEQPSATLMRVKGRGLVRVRSQQRPNMYICYSAWEGEAAFDGVGDERNGPFAKALDEALRSLQERTTHSIFKQTQLAVAKATDGQQFPMPVDQLDDAASRAQLFGRWAVPTPRPMAERQDFALIVANSHAGTPLARPLAKADAELMAQALTKCGFKCDVVLDATRAAFFERLTAFAKLLKAGGGDANGILFFSGYGAGVEPRFKNNVEIRKNYVLPEGVTPTSPTEITDESWISISQVILALAETRARAVSIIKDCNRDIGAGIGARGSNDWGDLGEKLEQENRNIVVVLAAQPNETSHDDKNGRGSIFVQALARSFASQERRSFQEALNGAQEETFFRTDKNQRPVVDAANDLPIFFADETGLARAS